MTASDAGSSKDEISILIVLMGSLGDLVRGFAVLRPLKEALPGCRVTWLVESKWAALVKLQQQVDDILVYRRERPVAGALSCLEMLRSRHFDITLDLQRHFKSGVCSFASGSARRIGFHPANAKEFNHLFNNEYVERCAPDYPKIYHYLKFVELLGGVYHEPLDFGLSGRTTRPEAAEPLQDPYVAVVMGSSRPEKDWTLERYQELLRRIIDEGKSSAVLLGDRSQKANAAALASAIGSPQLVNLTAATSLTDLVWLLEHAKAAVGPDSGPGHIAAAVNTPYVALFGPTCVPRVAPYRCGHLVVQAPSKRVSDISAGMVWDKLAPLLPLLG